MNYGDEVGLTSGPLPSRQGLTADHQAATFLTQQDLQALVDRLRLRDHHLREFRVLREQLGGEAWLLPGVREHLLGH